MSLPAAKMPVEIEENLLGACLVAGGALEAAIEEGIKPPMSEQPQHCEVHSTERADQIGSDGPGPSYRAPRQGLLDLELEPDAQDIPVERSVLANGFVDEPVHLADVEHA